MRKINILFKNIYAKKIEARFFLMTGLLILFAIPLIYASGVTTYYYDGSSEGDPGNPLYVSPGEEIDIQLELQNMVGNENVVMLGEIIEGSDIARIIDPSTKYRVPLGKKDVKVNIRVSMQEDAVIGSKRYIAVSFKEIVEGEGKMMDLATGVITKIPVVVRGKTEEIIQEQPQQQRLFVKPEEVSPVVVLLALTLSLVAVVLYFMLRRIKKEAQGNIGM